MDRCCIAGLDPALYRRHPLHAAERDWPETNCYTDVWIEILHAQGLDPVAGLAFTVAQDFEGDHFTFFKYPPEDLERLYGLQVSELAIYDSVEAQVSAQMDRGRLSLVEVDSFYLPDTAGVSYGIEHTKSTVAINRLDPEAHTMDYFHGAGFHRLSGEDFDGVLGRLPVQREPSVLFPYVEFVKFAESPASGAELVQRSLECLSRHLGKRPALNPVTAFAGVIEHDIRRVAGREPEFFHKYAFNTLRQIGANFALLASYVDWLGSAGEEGLEPPAEAARRLSSEAKVMQFQLARAVARKRFDGFADKLAPLETAYAAAIGPLAERYAA